LPVAAKIALQMAALGRICEVRLIERHDPRSVTGDICLFACKNICADLKCLHPIELERKPKLVLELF
jgi:hypothetical protein